MAQAYVMQNVTVFILCLLYSFSQYRLLELYQFALLF